MIDGACIWSDYELGRVFDYLLTNHIQYSPGERRRAPVPASVLPFAIDDVQSVVREQLEAAIDNKHARVVEAALLLAPAFEVPRETFFDLSCRLLTEDWHISHEDIIRQLQDAEDPRAIPFLKQVIELKPRMDYLDYDDYGAFYKKCLWALKAIGTEEAIAVIRDCASSNIEALRDEARYRLTKIES